jgi:phage terminase large subunit
MELNIKPMPKQAEAYKYLFDKETNYVVFGGAAAGGKSWLIAEWLLVMCLQYPQTRWFIGRKELKQLMGSTFVTFQEVCMKHNVPTSMWKLNGQYNYIEFKNGSVIDLLDLKKDPSDPMYQGFGSKLYTGGAIEEAGDVESGAFEILKTRVGRWQNLENGLIPKILITCNPTKNWVYSDFYIPDKKGELPDEAKFVRANVYDNIYTGTQYIKQLESIQDTVLRQRLLDGDWEYDDSQTALLNRNDIEDIFKVYVQGGDTYFMTADIARFGKDSTKVGIWNGYVLEKVYTIQGKSTTDVAQFIDRKLREHKIQRKNCVIDEAGIGGGVVDLLPGVVGFIGNASPKKNEYARNDMNIRQNFANLRSQCIVLMSDKIKRREVSITDTSIKEQAIVELEQWKLKEIDNDTKVAVISKDDMKSALGSRSPDTADMIYMRIIFDLDRNYTASLYGFTQQTIPEVEEMQTMIDEFDRFSPL